MVAGVCWREIRGPPTRPGAAAREPCLPRSRFSAYLVTRNDKGVCHGEVRTDLDLDQLPPGELLIRVQYSSINYKDALSATGHPGVTQTYPHVPGIDAAGTVAASQLRAVRPGRPGARHRLPPGHGPLGRPGPSTSGCRRNGRCPCPRA